MTASSKPTRLWTPSTKLWQPDAELRPWKRGDPYRLNDQRAERVQRFFERALVHTKGKWSRRPFLLEPFQWEEILRPLFGMESWDEEEQRWLRLYHLAWLEIARKNGKSELLAGCGLYMLMGDGEEGAEVYGAARDKDQAALVFNVAVAMIEKSPVLSRMEADKKLRIFRNTKRIVHQPSGSFYQVIAADAEGNLGQDPFCILFDEIVAQANRDLWDALKTGMGSRLEPLMLAATTAGNDPSGFAAGEHETSRIIGEHPEREPRRFVFMRNTPMQTDWNQEENWRYANPALGRFLRIEALREDYRTAVVDPSAEVAFRMFRLNQWQRSHSRWLPLSEWDPGAGIVDEAELQGRECAGGLDLASTMDTTALAWFFWSLPEGPEGDPLWEAIWRFWLPEARLPDLDKRTGGQASVWVRDGFLQLTEGNVTDYEAVRNRIRADAERFTIRQLAYDRWGATQLANELREDGLAVVRHGQGYKDMSPSTKEFARAVLDRRLRHGGNPVMRWQFENVVVRQDPAENIKPDKEKSAEKIDGVVAAIMALSRGLVLSKPRQRRGGRMATA